MRKALFAAILLIASVASAQMMHGRAASPTPATTPDTMMLGPSAAAVGGTVSSVNGNTITIANGLITIDATNAKIINGPVTSGARVEVVLKSGDVAANAPLPATVIAVVTIPQVSLTGSVTSVDAAHGQFVVLGKTIVVTSETAYDGRNVKSLADVQTNELALVEANVSNGALVATRVVVMAPMPQPSTLIHGTVKSIGTDSWVITTSTKDVTVTVNAQTKIVGDPKVGDPVDVAVRTDASNAYVATTIIKVIVPGPDVHIYISMGTVQSLSATALTITDNGKQTTFVINAQTKIMPGIGGGAKVIVAATKAADGTLTALAVGPQMM